VLIRGTLPESENDRRETEKGWAKSLGLFALIIGDLIGYTGAGIGLGYLAWAKAGAPWWVLLLFSIAGLAMAMVRLYRLGQKDQSE
jgi:F0F1-type ATP synthase assembly protein I